MSVTVIVTVAARLDLDRIFTYFVEQNRMDLVEKICQAFEETVEFIAGFPELGFPHESDLKRLANIRVKPLRGFEKYLAFYRVERDGVYILRLFHGHQDIENLL